MARPTQRLVLTPMILLDAGTPRGWVATETDAAYGRQAGPDA